jgi:hypothetical protein
MKTKAKDFSIVADIFPLAPEADRELNLITTQQISKGSRVWAVKVVSEVCALGTLRASVTRVRVTGFEPAVKYINLRKPPCALYHVQSGDHSFVVRPSRLFRTRQEAMHKAFIVISGVIDRLQMVAFEFLKHEHD